MRADVDYEAGTLTIRPFGVIWFVSAPALEDLLIHHLADHPDAERLVIDLGQAGRIDYTGAAALAPVAITAFEKRRVIPFTSMVSLPAKRALPRNTSTPSSLYR